MAQLSQCFCHVGALQDAAGQSANCGIELQVFEGKKAQVGLDVDGGGWKGSWEFTILSGDPRTKWIT